MVEWSSTGSLSQQTWCFCFGVEFVPASAYTAETSDVLTDALTVRFACTDIGEGIAQLVECPIEKSGAILTRVRVPGAARDFSPRVNFRCRLS